MSSPDTGAGGALYDELIAIGQQITRHRQVLAKPRVTRLVRDRIDAMTDNDALLAHLIAESLLKRIDRQLHEAQNIYVEHFSIPQIVLFYRLARAIPLIGASHAIANATMWSHLKGQPVINILDVGIGNGLQMRRLVSQIAQSGDRMPELIRIIGIDPVAENLTRTEASLAEVKRALGVNIEWTPLEGTLEGLPPDRLFSVLDDRGGPLAINAAFALHHTLHPLNDRRTRTRILAYLAALDPVVMTLCEPHSDHDTESLPRRIHHAWQHFGAVFDLIDESGEDAATCFTIKEKFFGREVRDMFGVSDHFRCERHELLESWLLRLARCQMMPATMAVPSLDLPPYIDLTQADGITRLGYRGQVILAVMAYRPKMVPTGRPADAKVI